MMARYLLLQPHHLTGLDGIARLVPAGAEIDSATLPPWWRPTPACHPLDGDAYMAVREVCNKTREAHGPGSVPAFGPLHRKPGGDLEGI